MSTMTPIPKDDPLMVEWENYKQTEEYLNSLKWAAHEEHREGSMWGAFMAGFLAAKALHDKELKSPLSNAKDMGRATDSESI